MYVCVCVYVYIYIYIYTVIPRLTSDPANEDFFRSFLNSANEYGFS